MRYAVSLGSIIFTLSFSAVADTSNQNNYGVSLGSPNALSVRKILNEATQIYAGASIGKALTSSNGNCCSGSANNYGMSLGARRFLTVAKLSTFGDATITWGYNKSSSSGFTGSSRSVSLNLSYGIEYFISTNLSVEGKAGVVLAYASANGVTGGSTKVINIPSVSTAVTYYW
jgi:hypothetical protein